MRLPKFGFNSAKARITAEVTLSELNKLELDVIDLQALKDADIVQEGKLRAKVMLSGEIGRAITLKGIGATKGARAAIEAAGGKIEE
jgi:large subunit ribosomal protein L15